MCVCVSVFIYILHEICKQTTSARFGITYYPASNSGYKLTKATTG